MSERIQKELALLRVSYPEARYEENGQWICIHEYPIPQDHSWNRESTDVCFQVPQGYPASPPYGFLVPSGIRCEDQIPESYTEPPQNKPPFPGDWGFFSWSHNGSWSPKGDLVSGSNLADFVRTFKDRFLQGR